MIGTRIGGRLVSLAAVALLAIGAVVSATPAEPTVDKIVADYIAARGGLKKLHSIQTLRQKGHAYADGGRMAVVMRELKRPGKVRFEFKVDGITAAFVTDGERGWEVSPFDGDMEAKPMPEEAVTDALEQADVEGPLVDWKAKGFQVKLVGHELVEGRDTYKLEVTLKNGFIRHDYIDVKTHYELRTVTTRLIGGKEVQLKATFGAFKKWSGILFPGTIVVETVGRPQHLKIFVDSIEANPPLSDDRFRMPKQLN